MNTHRSSLPASDPLLDLASLFTGLPTAVAKHAGNTRDHTQDRLIRTAAKVGYTSLSELLKADRKRIARCSANMPCSLLACPKCSCFIHKQTCDATLNASLEHMRARDSNGLINVRLSASADLWDVYSSEVGRLSNEFVLSLLMPALSKQRQVAGAHISLDVSLPESTWNRLAKLACGDAESLPVLDNSPLHVHLHMIIATTNVKKTEIKPLIERIISFIEDHSQSLSLEYHASCIENSDSNAPTSSNPNPIRPEYRPLATVISYNGKLQNGIKIGRHASTMTRILRSHLVGQPITWDAGIYARQSNATHKLQEDLSRLHRVAAYMQSLADAFASQVHFTCADFCAKSAAYSLTEWALCVQDRLCLDASYRRRHGNSELQLLWSNEANRYALSKAQSLYLASLELIEARQLVIRRRCVRAITKLIIAVLRLHRKSIHLDISNLSDDLSRYLTLLTATDRARQRLCESFAESTESVAVLHSIELMKSGNDVFPCWTPYDSPTRLRTRTWLALVVDMLFAAPPIHDALDERVTRLNIPESELRVVTPEEGTDVASSQTDHRTAWHPMKFKIDLDQLNIPQAQRYGSGRHPFGVNVHFELSDEYLKSNSPYYLRDWQLWAIETMRAQRVVRFACPVGSGKKWLLTHLPRMIPTASVLLVTRHEMDARAIHADILHLIGWASLVPDIVHDLTTDRVIVCSSHKLTALDCHRSNVLLSLDSHTYSQSARERFSSLQCDHWYDFVSKADEAQSQLTSPQVEPCTLQF